MKEIDRIPKHRLKLGKILNTHFNELPTSSVLGIDWRTRMAVVARPPIRMWKIIVTL